jgi:hypothetical protein
MKRQIVYPHMHMSVERLNRFLDGASDQDFLIASSLNGAIPSVYDKKTLTILTDADPAYGGLNYNLCTELKVVDAETHYEYLQNSLDIYIRPGTALTSDAIYTVGEKAPSGQENLGVDVKFTYPTTEVPSASGASEEAKVLVARIDTLCIKYSVKDSLPETLTFLDVNNNLYQEIRNTQRSDSYEIVIITGAETPDPFTIPPVPPVFIPDGYYALANIHLRYGTVKINNEDSGQQATGYLEDIRDRHIFYNKQITNEQIAEDDLTDYGATDTFYTSYNFLRSTVEVHLNGIRIFQNSGTIRYTVAGNNTIILSSPKGSSDSLVVSYTKKLY